MKTKHFLKLRGAVAAKGHTLTELAAHLDISQQALNEKLHGRKQFTLAEMIKTCNFLEAPVDIFFDPDLHNLQFTEMSKAQ